MIRLTNVKVVAFNTPLMGKLFSDPDRRFPVKVAFRIADFIQQVQSHFKAYNDTKKNLIEKHLGKIDPKTGAVSYPNEKNAAGAVADLEELNSIEIKCDGEKVVMSDDWPYLTLAEATILSPIIKR